MVSENFNQFGPTFQSKIISSLLSDNKFIQTINDILEPSILIQMLTNGYQKISKYFMSLEKLQH